MAALVVLLVGCGEARERTGASASTPNATTGSPVGASVDPGFNRRGVAEQRVEAAVSANTDIRHMPRPPQATATITQHDSTRHDAIPAFELVGTGIDGANAFAVVRTPDQGLVTVREGGLIGGYTVRTIQPDRIRLKARDDKEAMLVIGASIADRQPSTADADVPPSATSAESAFMAAGINTDQSIPDHVMYGPTARWPEGEKHIH